MPNSAESDASSVADVLIVGAGPTGLVLALWLAKAGVHVRIIDAAAEPGTTSRALVVHARTLEFYRQLGIDQHIVNAGVNFGAVNLWLKGRHAARVAFGDIGRGTSAFPYMLVLPQDIHERLLISELQSIGVSVERGVSLRSLAETGAGVRAVVSGAGGDRELRARYLAGCDGAHSVVRGAIGAGFPGGTYEHVFYVADVEAEGPVVNEELHVALDEAELLAVFPLTQPGRVRFVGMLRPGAISAGKTPGWEDVDARVVSQLGIRVDRVNWFSTYHVHHRVASHFRKGRVFLLGDAGHIHSPVGAQGMNTGIGDAVNLAWKLAAVLGGAAESLLDSYEPERIAFAKRLVATTDRAFTLTSKNGFFARFVRKRVLPAVFPSLTKMPVVRRFMFRTLSQTAIEYRKSPLSRGGNGSVHAGDRLPWVEHASADGADNYAPLERRAWQLHVYTAAALNDVAALCAERALALVRFPASDAGRGAGFRDDALYLVRPEGYIGYVGPVEDLVALGRYLDASVGARAGESRS